ncbi:SphA family protein [Brevundimonas lenta]|uniref:Phenol degradation protein meta n=1 Tax=Brevundimonas lenta TaxID=424796 RepID=A0A7W6JDN1_9CAUL|nr:transporter [Brevundimonas lenta]MBB4082212.1 hypothetical protein [Brevundimonas lenta]
MGQRIINSFNPLRMRGSLIALGCGLGLALAAQAGDARASEGGASLYLLGSGGPGTAIMPPVQGVFFANTLYHYEGSAEAERNFLVGGNLVAGLDADITANFASVLWVPSTDFLGGALGFGAIIPAGEPDVTVSAVITGPLGNSVGVSRNDSAFVVGDPVLMAMWGTSEGNTHFQVSGLLNIPAGDYREGELANLAFHRWAADLSFATTWRDKGWDVTGKVGVTFNGENDVTDYDTGTEFHAEASVEKIFSPAWSAGVQAYRFQQLTGDSGSGARLGPFKGEVTGLGVTVAHNFEMAGRPATLRLHAATEFDAVNRLEGDAIWLDFSIPLHMVLPPGAGGH